MRRSCEPGMRYPRKRPESNHLLTVRGATLQILATCPVVKTFIAGSPITFAEFWNGGFHPRALGFPQAEQLCPFVRSPAGQGLAPSCRFCDWPKTNIWVGALNVIRFSVAGSAPSDPRLTYNIGNRSF